MKWLAQLAAVAMLGCSTALAAGNAEDSDNPNLVYNPQSGVVVLEPGLGDKDRIIGFALVNNAALIKPRADATLTRITPWDDDVFVNTAMELSSFSSSAVAATEPLELGDIFPTGLDVTGLQQMLNRADVLWGLGISGRGQFDLIVVPEPAGALLCLVGLAGLLGHARRARR